MTPKNRARLVRASRPEGAEASRPGLWITLLKQGLVVRGPAPPRDNGGRLAYPVRMYATEAGRAVLASKEEV